MLRKIGVPILVALMAAAGFGLKVEYYSLVEGQDLSLAGFPSYVETQSGETITLNNGETLTLAQPGTVRQWIEFTWVTLPVKPTAHVRVDLKKFFCLKPDEQLCLLVCATQRRRIMLNWPPVSSPWHLPTGIPAVAAYLRERGHEVVQRYSHIAALEHGLCKYGGHEVSRALRTIRRPESDIVALYQARRVLEETSEKIPADGEFAILRNNVHYVSLDRDGTIAGVLRAVRNRERHIWYDHFREEVKFAENFRPDIYGISIADERQLLSGCVLASMVKDAMPGTMVVLGGNFWSQVSPYEEPDFQKFFAFCDAVVYREGFVPLTELTTTLNPQEMSGAVWFDGKEVQVNKPTSTPILFETLPTPVFEPEPKPWTPYTAYPLYTVSNCPYACGFCAIGAGSDTYLCKPRAMSPKRIAEHMIALGGYYFDIADESFLIDRQLALGRELAQRGYRAEWACLATADNRLINPGTCERLYAAGARNFQMGLEFLRAEELQAESKGRNKPEHYGLILRNLRQAGILTHVFGIIGHPSWPLTTGLPWLDFLNEHGRNILTLKIGRWRLVRMSPDGRNPRWLPLKVLPGKPLHPNFDFHYLRSGMSRKRVEALYDLMEQASREHWAFEVTSTIHWADRIRFTWNKFEAMAEKLPRPAEVPHLGEAVRKVGNVIREELSRDVQLRTFQDTVAFSQSLRS